MTDEAKLDEWLDGINFQDYNYVKCWLSITKFGRETLACIFSWTFKQHPSSIKPSLFQRPNYSMTKYRSDFDKSQRQKIEVANPELFDLPLFYLLLQRICHLPEPHANVWGRNGDPKSLANLLYRIKLKRNDFAHSNTNISSDRMIIEIQSLIELFGAAIATAGELCKIERAEIQQKRDKITAMLEYIRDSDINKSFLKGKIENLREEKISLAKSECRAELRQYYSAFSQMSLSPWTSCDKYQDIQNIFTDPLLKFNTNSIFQNQLKNSGIVRLEHLLVSLLPSGQLPTIITIMSKSGYGKTTICKFIVDCWARDFSKVDTLDDYDLVFYFDFRSSLGNNFDDLIIQAIPNACGLLGLTQLKQCLMSMKILFILDNVSDTDKCSVDILEFLCNINSDKIKLLATASQDPHKLISANATNKKPLTLHLYGIHEAQLPECIKKISSSVARPMKISDVKINSFCNFVLDINTGHSLLHSPEVIAYTFFHWLTEMSVKEYATSTRTEVYMIALNIHRNNVLRKMESEGNNILQKMVEMENINTFFNAVYLFAFETLSDTYLSFEQFQKLIRLGKELLLPYNYLLSEMFSFHEKFRKQSLKQCFSISFPSIAVQLFYSSMHLLNLMLADESHLDDYIVVGCDTLREESILMLFKNMVGICSSSNSYPEDYSAKIIDAATRYVDLNGSKNFGFWIDVICEAKFNRTVIDKAFKHMGPLWKVEDFYLSKCLIKLLDIVQPAELSIVVTDIQYIGNVSHVINSCMKRKNIKLSFYFYCHFWLKNEHNSDAYIELLAKSVTPARLESLAGKLSPQYYSHLPSTISHLALQVKLEDFKLLNNSLKNLPLLTFLCVNADIPLGCSVALATEILLPRPNVLLYLDLWNVDHSHVGWACEVAGRIAPAFSCIALRKTPLDFNSAGDFIAGLRHQRIHVDGIVIGSNVDISKDEKMELQRLAATFECVSFKWILR